jgi:hypothetical protein
VESKGNQPTNIASLIAAQITWWENDYSSKRPQPHIFHSKEFNPKEDFCLDKEVEELTKWNQEKDTTERQKVLLPSLIYEVDDEPKHFYREDKSDSPLEDRIDLLGSFFFLLKLDSPLN